MCKPALLIPLVAALVATCCVPSGVAQQKAAVLAIGGAIGMDCGEANWSTCYNGFYYWDVYHEGNVVRLTLDEAAAPYTLPAVTLPMLDSALQDAWDVVIESEGHHGAFAIECYSSWFDWYDKWLAYVAQYGESSIVGFSAYAPYRIGFSQLGIRTHLSDVNDDALIIGGYCSSCEAADDWLLNEFGSIVCSTGGPGWWNMCLYIAGMSEVLSCSEYPDRYPIIGGAFAHIEPDPADSLVLLGYAYNKYSDSEGCNNPRAVFNHVHAYDGTVSFSTASEIGSVAFFVMGLDTPRDVDRVDWTSWDVLAKIEASGERDGVHRYEVSSIPEKALYWVVEVDALGRPTFSPPFTQSDSHPDPGMRLPDPMVALYAPVRSDAGPDEGSMLVARRAARGISGSDLSAGVVGGASSRADSSDCADVFIYTHWFYINLMNDTGLRDHIRLTHPGAKIRSRAGLGTVSDAQDYYAEIYSANVAYNSASGTSRFPVDPGPLLILVGDESIVGYGTFPNSYDRCVGSSCKSDLDATRLFENEPPVGPVHRIPTTLESDVTRACDGADDWNRGEHVDVYRRVISVVGNRLGDSITGGPVELAEEVATEFLAGGFIPNLILADGDYDAGDVAGRNGAFDQQLSEGAAVLWGFGLGGTWSERWPGDFVAYPDTTLHPTKQRLIALVPGCDTTEPPYDLAKEWLFSDPRFTNIVGSIGHMDGGWEHQHAKAAQLYVDAWREAPPDAPLGWVVWRAAQMAQEQGLDWMADYLRSASTIGAYVLAHPGGGEDTSITVTQSDSLVFCPSGCGTGVDAITAVVTARDMVTGGPLPGIPPEQVKVFVVPSDASGFFSFPCSDDLFGPYRCLMPPDSTDANGQAFVPLVKIGGYDTLGYVAVAIDDGATTQFRSTRITFKSPDYDADGDVDPVDLVKMASDLQAGTGWRSDFDWDGDVDPIDFSKFAAHFAHGCGSKRTLRIPPELLAQLGLMPTDESITELPSSYSLGQSSPNPSNPVTLIGYAVPPPGGRVTIEVFDIAGRHVTTLVDVDTNPGWYAVTWDGTADAGGKVASGVYFYRMSAPGFADRCKLVLMK
ncbi:MAG: FlgD immunoglobulin-like domain containing protein [Candidatus Eisenbacteria bacterium]